MKHIARLEKSKTFWSLFLISVLFFLLRFPSIIEPNWYGDEGIYQIIGMSLNQGTLLYQGIWDNKPPLLYLVYALFNGDQFSVRLFSLFVGLATTWIFFFLSRKLFDHTRNAIIATSLFAFLFAIPFFEGNIANAENFMLLPLLTAGLLIYQSTVKQTKKLFFAGLLLGIAFLFKIVAVFDLAAFLTFIFFIHFPFSKTKKYTWKIDKEKMKTVLLYKLPLLGGFILPVVITALYFVFTNTFVDFFRATFLGNIGYVGYGNKLFFPQDLLILKVILLAGFLFYLAVKQHKFSNPAFFVLIWTAFSLFSTLFSQRPYTHYVLVLLPSFCLLVGLILNEEKKQLKRLFIMLLLLVIVVIQFTFKFSNFKKTPLYYQNAILFLTGNKDVRSYQGFFDGKTPRDYELAGYLKMHLNPGERVFIWGDSAQLYVLSNTYPLNKYTVAYHTAQSRESLIQTQAAINKIQPKFVVILPEARTFPFKLTDYISTFSVRSATIYERAL